MISVNAEKCPLSTSPPLSLPVSPSLLSYSLNSCCVSLFVIFVLFFHLAPCDKIFACLRTSWPSCFPGFSLPSLPSARSPPQSLSQSVSQQASAARDDRSEACACPGPFSGWPPCLLSLPALLLCCTRNLALYGAAIPNSRCCANFVMRLQIFNNCPDL